MAASIDDALDEASKWNCQNEDSDISDINTKGKDEDEDKDEDIINPNKPHRMVEPSLFGTPIEG